MTRLAFASLRHRATASLATFVTVLLGTALMGSFATLAATGTGPVSATDADTLFIMGAVVGGWGALIVLFAVVSTVGITVTQREVEIGLLRTIGATPRQARRLVRAETVLVAAAAAAIGAVAATFGGRAPARHAPQRRRGRRLGAVRRRRRPRGRRDPRRAGQPASAPGSPPAARPADRPTIAPSEGVAGAERLRWWRIAAAVLLIGYALAMGVVTITVTAHDKDPYAAMQTSGSCSILVALGLASLAPWLLKHLSVLARPAVGAGVAGHLAAYNTRRRAHLLGGVLAPVIVLTAAATSMLMAVGTDDRTRPSGSRPGRADRSTCSTTSSSA